MISLTFFGNFIVNAEEFSQDGIVTKNLSDGQGNWFRLVETGEKGFYIFDNSTNRCLEYSEEAVSPYIDGYEDLYYFGPLCYSINRDGNLIHSITKQSISDSDLSFQQESFKEALGRMESSSENNNNENFSNLYSERIRASNYYISNYRYIRDAVYPRNTDGTCGYTASCLVLNYWNKVRGGYVPSEFLNGGNLKTSGYTLQDKLISYSDSNDSWGRTIRNSINSLCSEYSIPGQAHYRIGKIGVSSEISNNRPAIIFGWLPSNPSSASNEIALRGKVFHAVTAYSISGGYFIFHYGWSGYEYVKLDGGLVGSCTLFNPN